MENVLHIKASKNQLSKMKNGHNVRISPAMEGCGVNLMVEPQTYALAKKAFMKGKGIQMKLSPKEISLNKMMKGTGIFGKKFDKTLDKYGLKEAAYKTGDALKPAVQAAILGGLMSGATALSASELVASGGLGAGAVPAIYSGAGTLGYLATDYLDNPSKYQKKSNIGNRNATAATSLAGQMAKQEALNQLSLQTGEKYNPVGQANLMTAVANQDSAKLKTAMINDLTNSTIPLSSTPAKPIVRYDKIGNVTPDGMYDINGYLITGQGIHRRREVSSIGRFGGFVGANQRIPQALQSQPFSANFQFKRTLPPQYAKFTI
jgi:hypothetical protein